MPEPVAIAERAARAGADVLARWAGRVNAREKGPADLVTQADIESQETIQRILLEAFPDYGFWGEEGSQVPSLDGYVWVVDPLDGTTNFVHGVPQYCVSVGLLRDGTPVAGCIYDPSLDESFTAALGHGTKLNGQPVHCSSQTQLSAALIAATFAARVDAESPEIGQFLEILLVAQAVRRTGSAAINLAYLASGRFDGYWSCTTHAWDVAAGLLMVSESGGTVSGLGGELRLERPRFIAAATPQLHAEMTAAIEPGPQWRRSHSRP